MSIPFLKPSRCVLLVGDDALHIFDVRSSTSRRVKTVPWKDDNFVDEVLAAINKYCKGKSILILNDMVEQHYRKEKIPNVGALDKANVVQRRLNVSFPNYPIRAALPLKEKAGEGGKGSVYLFAALAKNNYFSKIVTVAKRTMADIAGFCLLPVESSTLVSKLSEKVFPVKTGRKKAKWTVFIGQHYGGGLRQIVVRDGELALTRLTPIVDTDKKLEVWAAEVAQEFKATMSYLSRFGFSSEEGLNVILISNPKAGEIVGEIIDTPCDFKAMTAVQAAGMLGISIGIQEDMRYADPIHASWAGQSRSFTLPLKSTELTAISQPRKIASAIMALLIASLGYLTYDISDKVSSYFIKKEDLKVAIQALSQVDEQLNNEIKRKEDMGIDIRKIQTSLSIYEKLQSDSMDPIPMFQVIGRQLGGKLKLDKVSMSEVKNKKTKNPRILQNPLNTKDITVFETVLEMSFAPEIKPEQGNAVAMDLRNKLASVLPSYKVRLSKKVQDLSHQGVIEDTISIDKKKNVAKRKKYTAKISIRGVAGNE